MMLRVKIVADDIKGYGTITKYVDQCGTVIGNKPRRNRVLPIIKLDSGETVCSRHIWVEPITGCYWCGEKKLHKYNPKTNDYQCFICGGYFRKTLKDGAING